MTFLLECLAELAGEAALAWVARRLRPLARALNTWTLALAWALAMLAAWKLSRLAGDLSTPDPTFQRCLGLGLCFLALLLVTTVGWLGRKPGAP